LEPIKRNNFSIMFPTRTPTSHHKHKKTPRIPPS
jgi:hypothetical protein